MKKRILLIIPFLISIFLTVGITSAYFNTSTSKASIFKTNGYTIKLNGNGGTYKTGSTVKIKNKNITLPTPSRNGYTFLGYSTSNNGSVNYSTSVSNVDSINNKEIYAKWQVNSYSISYNLNGGSISGQKTSYTVEDSFTLPTPTRTGYTFTGWTGSNGTTANTSVTVSKGNTGNKSYTANWKINTYVVDINPIIQNVTYNSGLDSFTFSVWLNGNLVAQNVTDYYNSAINYGSTLRVYVNDRNGYNVTSFRDNTWTVTSSFDINPSWYDNIGPTITGYSVTGMTYYGYNSKYNYTTYSYWINASASDVNGVSKICYALWSNASNRWLTEVCHDGGSNSEDYIDVVSGWRTTRITAYDGYGNTSYVDFGYNVP